MLLEELDGPQGRADLVYAQIQALPTAVSLDVLAASLAAPAKARLLALLRNGAPRGIEYLERSTGLSKRSLRRHVQQLERSGLVQLHRSSAVSLGFPLPWSMVDIAAYEVKLSNWRRALHQALGYRSFSRCVWVVMPASRARYAKKLAAVFRINGIGLISIDDNGAQNIEIRGRKRRRPASRRLYLMAVGVILKRFIEETRGLHHSVRSESLQSV